MGLFLTFLFVGSCSPMILMGLELHRLSLNITIDGIRKVIELDQSSALEIIVNNIPKIITYLVFEAHTQVNNITLSFDLKPVLQNKVSGTNIGMVHEMKNSDTKAQIYLLNHNVRILSALLIILPLDSYGPIPGGCNMEFPTEIAPYLRLKNDFIHSCLEYQHANIGSPRDAPLPLCSQSVSFITYDVYVLFLKENDFGADEYIKKIENMSSVSYIKQHATKVKSFDLHPDTRYTFFKYPKLGVIYNVIAKYKIKDEIKESAYVPVATYGCDFSSEYGCRTIYKLESKLFLFFLSMFGFIIAFFGHEFFRIEMFFFGFVSFTFIGFMSFVKCCHFTELATLELAAALGLAGGIFWLVLWLKFHNPIFSLAIVGFDLGFLIIATILYTPLGNESFMGAYNFWLILCGSSLFLAIIFLLNEVLLSIIGSSVVGSYVALLFYDDFIGTRLAYIMLNLVKKTMSADLSIASNNYPFEIVDILIYCAWVFISGCAITIQYSRYSSCYPCSAACRRMCSLCLKQAADYPSTIEPLLADDNSKSYETFYTS